MSLDHGPGTGSPTGSTPAPEAPKRSPLGEEAVPMRSLADRQLEEENRARLQPVIGRRRRLPRLRRPPLPHVPGRVLLAALGACLALALLALALGDDETRVDPGPRATERTSTESTPLATATPNDQRANDRAAASTRRRAALLAKKAARRRVSRPQHRPQAPPPRPAPQPAEATPTAAATETAPVSATASEPPSYTPPPSTAAPESPSPSVAQREFNFER
ncbi:MAG: hypothetical protein R2725_07185 [Solirubrobacterales bacterium]